MSMLLLLLLSLGIISARIGSYDMPSWSMGGKCRNEGRSEAIVCGDAGAVCDSHGRH
jgi:hypothetical protein